MRLRGKDRFEILRGRVHDRMRCHEVVLKEEESVRHEDDTGESALYSYSLVLEVTVSPASIGFSGFSGFSKGIIEARPKGSQCVK